MKKLRSIFTSKWGVFCLFIVFVAVMDDGSVSAFSAFLIGAGVAMAIHLYPYNQRRLPRIYR